MKKNFTFFGKRLIVALVAFVAFAVNASAGSTFYAYYSKVTAYPSGKGQVYASDEFGVENPEYKDESEHQMVSTAGTLNIYAKPADGYLFAGVSIATPQYDDLGAITGYGFNDVITYTGNPASVSLTSDATDNPSGDENITSDSTTVAGMMPLDPNNVFYALFTKVTVEVAENQSTLGYAEISKVCNDKGDEITLTATPGEGSTFVGWTLNGETVSTDAQYTITVGDNTAAYVANFDNPNLITLDFPEYGGYINWNDDVNDLTLPVDVYSYTFLADSTVIDGDKSYSTPMEGSYNVSCQNPTILFGFGSVKVLKSVADPDYIYVNEMSLNRWSGDNGVNVSDLDQSYAYYTADMDNGVLNLASQSIPASQVYVAMPDSVYKNAGLEAAPAVIYTSVWAAGAGIENVKALNMPGVGKVYAIDGKQVAAPKNDGLYIIDGKKVLYKKN